jgi:hypothetical protein
MLATTARLKDGNPSRRKHMGGKQMEGDNRERRKRAAEAREAGMSASEMGATTGASKQRAEAKPGMSHQQRIDLKRQGKRDTLAQKTPEARPGSRDPDSPDHETYPRL